MYDKMINRAELVMSVMYGCGLVRMLSRYMHVCTYGLLSACRHYGIAVYSKTPLEVRRYETAQCAIEVVSFYVGQHLVLAVYWSPFKGTLQELLDLLFSAWHERLAEANRVVIVGDFNVDVSRDENTKMRLLTNWMAQQFFHLFALGPMNEVDRCIKHVWHNEFIGGPNETFYCKCSTHKNVVITLCLGKEGL